MLSAQISVWSQSLVSAMDSAKKWSHSLCPLYCTQTKWWQQSSQ